MILNSLDQVFEIAKSKPPRKMAIAAAADEHALAAVKMAMDRKIISPILIGETNLIEKIAKASGFPIESVEIIDEKNPVEASRIAVELVREGQAEILMKGLVGTADLLKTILNRETGIGNGGLMTHAAFIECPSYHKLLCVTDAGMNIAPGIKEKVQIIKNAVSIYTKLRLDKPRVAVLAAVEVVNDKMQATIDAAMLTQMNRRGQIEGCIIDGPFAFDNVVSKEACKYKKIVTDVGGDTDIVLCPNLETGNTLYKTLTYLAGSTAASVMLGARVPVVLNSRSDSDRSKLMSIALAAALR